MNQSKQVIVGLAAAIIMSSAGAVPALGGILFSVGDFDSWTTHAVHAPNANSTQTYFASSTGGNPGGMFTAYSTRADTHTVESAHIYEDQLTLSPLWGTFDLAFQYQRAAAADNGGYSTGLAIRQGSSYWGVGYNQVFDSVPWSNGSLQGAFESQNFGALYGTTGSPVLTGGVPTYFGFYTGRVCAVV